MHPDFLILVTVFGPIFGVILIMFGVGICISYRHRIGVTLMRQFGLHLYPEAIAIAVLIMEHPDQWNSDEYHLSHRDIGSIGIANEAYGLRINTAMGEWKPNAYERQIIRDAVDWRLNQYIRNRIGLALQQNGHLPPSTNRLG